MYYLYEKSRMLQWNYCSGKAYKQSTWGVPKSTPHFHSLFRKGGQKVAKTETQKKKDFAFSLI